MNTQKIINKILCHQWNEPLFYHCIIQARKEQIITKKEAEYIKKKFLKYCQKVTNSTNTFLPNVEEDTWKRLYSRYYVFYIPLGLKIGVLSNWKNRPKPWRYK